MGRMYFTSDDGSQNTLVYQPTLEFITKKRQRYRLCSRLEIKGNV